MWFPGVWRSDSYDKNVKFAHRSNIALLVDSDQYVPFTIYNASHGISIRPNFNSLFDGWQLLRGLLTGMNGCGLTMMVWLFSPCYISVVNSFYFDHLYQSEPIIIMISHIMITQLYHIVSITDNRPMKLSYHLEI